MTTKVFDREDKQRELEICMTEIKKDIEYIKKALDENRQIMNTFIANVSTKYALKYVEEELSLLKKKQARLELIAAVVYGGLFVIYIILQYIL